MVTIWHRVRKGVSGIGDTEWALLLFETVGIVLGVLLAVQVGTWIEDRKEAREQREQLERLHLESQETVRFIRSSRDRLGRIENQMITAFDSWINQDQCPTPEQWNALGAVGMMPAITPQRAAYDEMLGSGGLGRIENRQVREAVSNFYSTLDFHQQQLDYFRQISLSNDGDLNRDDDVFFDTESGYGGFKDGWQSDACNDRKYRASFVRNFSLFSGMQDLREQLTADAIKMCIALADELGEECVPSDGDPLAQEDIAVARGQPPVSE